MSKVPSVKSFLRKTTIRTNPIPGRRAPGKSRTKAPAKPSVPSGTWRREKPPTVLTVGHSTRTIGEFIKLLLAHEVTRVVDVRTVPRSRHNPQFNRDTLPASLKGAGIGYVHLAALGGLRHTTRDSSNTGWRNASFRGYADYMQTKEFAQAVEKLMQWAERDRIALMCAEAVPWRCHRSLIEDALLARGIRSEDIMSPTRRQPHALTAFAKVKGIRITYPALKPGKARKKGKTIRPSPKRGDSDETMSPRRRL